MTAYAMTNVGLPRTNPGETVSMTAYYTLAGGVVTGDTFTATNILPPLSNPVRVRKVTVYGVEADTNASPSATIIVGDGTDTDAYVESKTWGDANGQYQVIGDGVAITGGAVITVSRNMVITLGGTVATAASSGKIFLHVEYECVGA